MHHRDAADIEKTRILLFSVPCGEFFVVAAWACQASRGQAENVRGAVGVADGQVTPLGVETHA